MGLDRGKDSEGSVLSERRELGSSATSGLAEKPQGTEEQKCPSVFDANRQLRCKPCVLGQYKEGGLCGWGIETKLASETSRFLIQLMRLTVLGVTTLKPTAHSSVISGKASDG